MVLGFLATERYKHQCVLALHFNGLAFLQTRLNSLNHKKKEPYHILYRNLKKEKKKTMITALKGKVDIITIFKGNLKVY